MVPKNDKEKLHPWHVQLAFTGSTEVGKLIGQETAKNVVPTTLELVRHTIDSSKQFAL